MEVLLVGAGPMSEAYTSVLVAQGHSPKVVCRTKESATLFQERTKCSAEFGGIDEWLTKHAKNLPSFAIIATPVETLFAATLSILNAGIKNILVEKPAGLNKEEVMTLAEKAKEKSSNVLVAYNRRFYASTLKAQEIIQQDGGVRSFFFEFTEWAHVIEPLKKGEGVKEKWFLGNSTHIADLAFYLGGNPKDFHTYYSGDLSWHSSASVFSGAGCSEKGALFSYLADWQAPGRWSVEILTAEHRLYFKPVEQLHIQKKGSVKIEQLPLEDELDLKFKPGLYKMTEAFLNGQKNSFCSIEEQSDKMDIYYQMANYH